MPNFNSIITGTAFIYLTGGNFQDVLQNPIANGTLKLVLSQSTSTIGYWYENLSPLIVSPLTVGQISAGTTFTIPLDNNGNIITSPAYGVYANDKLSPTDSYYLVSCYNKAGGLVWGPNPQVVLSSVSPLSDTFDIGQWTPGQIQEF